MTGPQHVTAGTFRVCGICAGLFLPDQADDHQAWHDRLDAAIDASKGDAPPEPPRIGDRVLYTGSGEPGTIYDRATREAGTVVDTYQEWRRQMTVVYVGHAEGSAVGDLRTYTAPYADLRVVARATYTGEDTDRG